MGKKQTNWIKDYQFRSCNVNNILGALSASLPPLAMSHDRSKEMILVLLEYIGNILHANIAHVLLSSTLSHDTISVVYNLLGHFTYSFIRVWLVFQKKVLKITYDPLNVRPHPK